MTLPARWRGLGQSGPLPAPLQSHLSTSLSLKGVGNPYNILWICWSRKISLEPILHSKIMLVPLNTLQGIENVLVSYSTHMEDVQFLAKTLFCQNKIDLYKVYKINLWKVYFSGNIDYSSNSDNLPHSIGSLCIFIYKMSQDHKQREIPKTKANF